LTLEASIASAADFAKEAGMTPEQMTEWAKKTHPTLKRWQNGRV
jgi:hypothetical protein